MMSDAAPLFYCEALTGPYGLTSPLSCTVTEPGLVGVIGPNGAGKSTLLRLALGVERRATGEVLISGHSIKGCPPERRARLVSYLPQSPPSSPHWTLSELVSQGQRPCVEVSQTERQAQLLETLRALQLDELSARRVSEVSGGELRRAFVGRALIQQASVALLDEPLAHLDWGQSEQLLRLIRSALKGSGRLALITLHDLNLASLYCDQLILLSPGRAPLSGRPEALIGEGPLSAAFGRKPLLIQHPHEAAKILAPHGPSQG